MGIFDKLKKKSDDKQPTKAASVKDDSVKKDASKKETTKDAPAKDNKETKVAEAKPLTDTHSILVKPMLTEKTFKMQQESKYGFYVKVDANKHQVKAAIKDVYGVAPVSVNMIKKKPRKKYRWGREVGQTKRTKKAIVTMPKGTVLNLTD